MKPTALARYLLVVGGALALCAALAVTLVPLDGVLETPWTGGQLLVTFFVVAFTLAWLVGPIGFLGRVDGTDHAGAPPESVPSTSRPGRDLERVLDDRWPASLPPARRRRLRARLRRTAIRTVTRTSDCSVEIARERVERGIWTDDPVAATFVRRGDSPPSRVQSLVDRLRFRRRARRTARAILALDREGDDP